MSFFRPVQVFTELKSKDPFPLAHISNKSKCDPLEKMKTDVPEPLTAVGYLDRQINVTGIGEMTLPPDRFSITIRCKSSKDNIQDAKNSITRRVDYIVQALKNSALKSEDYKVFQHTSHSDGMVIVDSEVEAHFMDIGMCQGISNLLAEKLGPSISITLPHCYHSRGSLDKLRKQAGMLAIHNARQKALEMARVLHLTVGPALKIQELETLESLGTTKECEDEFDLLPSIQKKVADATAVFKNKVSVTFQLNAPKLRKN